MVYDYLITVKKRDYRFIDQVSQLMYIFAISAFAFYYYQNTRAYIYLIVILAIISSWGFTLMKKKKNGDAFFRIGLLLGAVGWIAGPHTNILMGVLYGLAGIIEKQVKFPQEIGFTPAEVTFNTLPSKTLKWSDINNVVIKDGLITIDQKSNKIYQKEIEGYVTADIEAEFNEFAKRCIQEQSPA